MYYIHGFEALVGSKSQELDAVVKLKRNELSNWLDEVKRDGAWLQNSDYPKKTITSILLNPSNKILHQEINLLFTSLIAHEDYEFVAVYDSVGKFLAGTRDNRTPLTDKLVKIAKTSIRLKQIQVCDICRESTADSSLSLEFIVPIVAVDKSGKSVPGVVVISIDPSVSLFPIFSSIPVANKSIECILAQKEGDSIEFLTKLRYQSTEQRQFRVSFREDLPVAQPFFGKEGVFTGFDYRNEKVVSSVYRVPDSDWVIVAKIDLNELKEQDALRYYSILFVMFLTILTCGSIIYSIHRYQQHDFLKRKLEDEQERSALESELRKERERSEEAVRTQSRQLDSYFMHSLDLLCIASTDGYFLRLNKEWENTLGYKLDDLEGKRFLDMVHPDDLQATLDAVSRLAGDNAVLNFVNRYRKRDGTYRFIEWRSYPHEGVIFAAARDITDRLKAEEALRASEATAKETAYWLQRSQRIGRLGSYVLDVNTGVWQSSEVLDVVFGIEKDYEKTVASWAAIVHPDYRERMIKYFTDHVVRDRNLFDSVYKIVRQNDGAERWVHGLGELSVDEHGNILTMFGTIQDITDLQNANVANEELAQQWQQTFDAVSDGIAIIDPERRIVRFNQAFLNFTDLASEQITNQFCHKIIHNTDDHLPECPIERAKQTLRREVMEVSSNNRHLEVVVDPMTDKAGQFIGVVHVMRDVTERKNLEMQLAQSQKMDALGRLAGGVAHDFNNLLTVFSGTAELIKVSLPDNDPIQDTLDQLLTTVQRGSTLTRQLLAFSRNQPMQPRALNLNRVIDDMQKMLHRLIGEDVELIFILGGDLPSIYADAGQIEQVIMNLVVNARDAMPRGGKITIETEFYESVEETLHQYQSITPGKYCRIVVSDTGCGMSEEVLQHALEPFFTTKPAGKGTGLGLSTVHGIVKQSKGYLTIYSEPNIGTAIKIYFPISEETPDEMVIKTDIHVALGSERILVIEDEPHIRELVSKVLSNTGYMVVTASDGEEAWTILQTDDKFDLMVSDVIMPRMGGIELYQRISENKLPIKVLFMSGYTLESGLHTIQALNTPFIHKPFSAQVLLEAIRKALTT
ncbi:MAG: PAS domain S-box protein [bacterium]|nr:PAS domain S-box protein [bacterium]